MTQTLAATPNLAIFCDYENVALGVRDAKYDSFDLQLVLARLLDKGKVIVKKAYCDWERYKGDRKQLHEAGFELIEVPHVSYSGKNSADIRMVVDALDMCHTKSHIDMFVIVSGDSDFSPLVNKLRENNKAVVGVGVKNSSSNLLVENCDEFIYYDDLVRETRQGALRSQRRKKAPATAPAKKGRAAAAPEGASEPGALPKARAAQSGASSLETQGTKDEAIELVIDTAISLLRDHDDVWGSMVKQAIKRKRPTFNETLYGYKSFNDLLEEARERGQLELRKDERSGGYLVLHVNS